MFQWIGENAGTVIVSIALIALVAGIVVRLFESEGKAADVLLAGSGWQETDMLEGHPVPVSGPLHFRPYEIKTLFLALPSLQVRKAENE